MPALDPQMTHCYGENRLVPTSEITVDKNGNRVHGDHYVDTGYDVGTNTGAPKGMFKQAQDLLRRLPFMKGK